MLPARDQLIGEWQDRLAAAEEATPERAARPAWLLRLRVRMYRFLLSLYGKGEWNAAQPGGGRESATSPDQPANVDLSGKPAKDAAHIRAVLAQLSLADENKCPRGPATAADSQEVWQPLAVCTSGKQARHCMAVLARQGLHPRSRIYDRKDVIEVPPSEHGQAQALLQRWLATRSRTGLWQRGNPAAEVRVVIIVAVSCIVAVFLVGLAIVAAADIETGIAHLPIDDPQRYALQFRSFSRTAALVLALVAQIALLLVIRFRRIYREAQRRQSRSTMPPKPAP